ncbi:MAG: heme lyase CcmF/NrfE family subunit, partial [Acidimicrobiia bacterium]
MNAALGTAGAALGFAGALLGALTLAVGLRRHQPSLLRQGRGFTLVVLAGALLAFLVMEKALLTHDFSL